MKALRSSWRYLLLLPSTSRPKTLWSLRSLWSILTMLPSLPAKARTTSTSPYSSVSLQRWCRQIRRWHPMLRLLLDGFGLFVLRLLFILLGLLRCWWQTFHYLLHLHPLVIRKWSRCRWRGTPQNCSSVGTSFLLKGSTAFWVLFPGRCRSHLSQHLQQWAQLLSWYELKFDGVAGQNEEVSVSFAGRWNQFWKHELLGRCRESSQKPRGTCAQKHPPSEISRSRNAKNQCR